MSTATLKAGIGWTALLAAGCVLVAFDVMLAYQSGPAVALAAPIVVAVLAAVVYKPILGLYFAVLVVPLERLSIAAGAAGLSPTELLVLLAAGSAVARFALGENLRPIHPVHRAFAALIVVVFVGVLVAEDQVVVLKTVVMWTAFLIAGLLIARSPPKDIIGLLVCIVMAAGVLGILAAASGTKQELVRGGAAATGRAEASFAQPNQLGFFCVLAIPIGIVLSSMGPGWRRALLLLAGALAVAGLMFSLSRTSIIGAALGLAVLLAWPAFRRLAAVGLAALIVFASFNAQALEQSDQAQIVTQRLSTLTQAGQRSKDPRIRIWKIAPEVFYQHPVLGVGVGNFPVQSVRLGLIDESGFAYAHAHNVALNMLAETGLIGFVLFSLMVVLIVYEIRRALRRGRGSPYWPVVLGLAAALSGLVVVGLGDHPFGNRAIMATIVFEFSAIIGLSRAMRFGEDWATEHAPRSQW